MKNVIKIIKAVVFAVVVVVALGLLMAFPTMWLWNWLMPDLFGLTTITVDQAFGLNILTGLFFRSSSTVKKS